MSEIDSEGAFRHRQDTIVAFVLEALAVANGKGDPEKRDRLLAEVRAQQQALDEHLRAQCAAAAQAWREGRSQEPQAPTQDKAQACSMPNTEEIDVPGYCPT